MRATAGVLAGATTTALAGLPQWLIVTMTGLAVVLLALLLFVPADGPITRFERFTAALRGTPSPRQKGGRQRRAATQLRRRPPGNQPRA